MRKRVSTRNSRYRNGQTSRLRVAVVAECFPNYRRAVLAELARDPGIECSFLGGRKPLLEGYHTIQPDHGNSFVPLRTVGFGHLRWQHGLLREIFTRQYDAFVMTGDWAFISTWVGAVLARMLGRPVLFWTHGWNRPESGIRLTLRRSFYRLADGLLLYGQHGRTLAEKFGFQSDRIYVVYNSLDLPEQLAAAAEIKQDAVSEFLAKNFSDPHLPLIVSSFRLVRERSVGECLQAVAHLYHNGFPINYLVVGEGPDLVRLRSISVDLEIPVVFFGACYDEQTLAIIYAAAAVSLAPRMVGLSALQSLAYATPVLTCDNIEDQTPEWEILEDGISAGFFPAGDVIAMSRVIQKWITLAQNDGINPEILRRQLVEKYNPTEQARRIGAAVRTVAGCQETFPAPPRPIEGNGHGRAWLRAGPTDDRCRGTIQHPG